MGKEIERKFIVKNDNWNAVETINIIQGYLNSDKNRIVRIRIDDTSAFITIKGLTVGCERLEYEYEIPVVDGNELIKLCETPILEKKRSIVVYDGKKWEIDEFYGQNAGLIVAEIELTDKDEKISIPEWIGKEITNDKRYYNSNLISEPFKNWKDTK